MTKVHPRSRSKCGQGEEEGLDGDVRHDALDRLDGCTRVCANYELCWLGITSVP